jgi:hypothetical protein
VLADLGVLACNAGLLAPVSGCAPTPLGPESALRDETSRLRAASEGGELATERAAEERRELADALDRAPLERRALVTVGGEGGAVRSLVLVEEDGAFRVEAGILGVPSLDTPERAIAALHRALAREISLGPGALLVEEERRAWLEERMRYRDGTASPEALDVRVEGDSATATTPLGDEIVLLREGAEWRVASMRAAGLE